jgi:hypothetical protein
MYRLGNEEELEEETSRFMASRATETRRKTMERDGFENGQERRKLHHRLEEERPKWDHKAWNEKPFLTNRAD